MEFTEYRQYSPGDDPRYLDWKLYARSDRDYIKRFEDETNLRCQLILDQSRSMDFTSELWSKSEYAKTLAATLAWFLFGQRDAVGLMTFSDRLHESVPARYRHGHLRRLLLSMEKRPENSKTDLVKPLEQVIDRLKRRGLVILISDLLAPLEGWEDQLGMLAVSGQEVMVFQTLDPREIDFAYADSALFEDLETGEELYIQPNRSQKNYQDRMQEHLQSIQASCGKLGVTYRLLSTREPMAPVLTELLRSRLR